MSTFSQVKRFILIAILLSFCSLFESDKNVEISFDFKSLECYVNSDLIASNATCFAKKYSKNSLGTMNVYFVLFKELNEFYVRI